MVGELRVKDGDRVKASDLLVRLDDTITRANLAIVTKTLTELTARKARLSAERDGSDRITFPDDLMREADVPDVAQAMAAEVKLFDLRRSARAGQKSQLRERINQANEEIVGFGSQKTAKDKEIAFIENELIGVRDLYQKNLVPITRLSQLEREATRLGGERGQLIAATAQAKGKIAELQLQIIQVDQDLSSEVAKEMREIDARIGEFIERKVSALDQLKRTDIRAPQDGTVFQSTVHTIGGVIPAGEPIMMIVPDCRPADGGSQGQSAGHRQGGARAERDVTLFSVQYAHDAGDFRERLAGLGRHHDRPAHEPELLHDPDCDAAGRGCPPRQCQARAGNAGRGLRQDGRAHGDVVSDEAALGPDQPGIPGIRPARRGRRRSIFANVDAAFPDFRCALPVLDNLR